MSEVYLDPRMDIILVALPDASFGRCSRCDLSWKRVKGHFTPYVNGHSCFPLCIECWNDLTPESRLPHYRVLFDRWAFDAFRRGMDMHCSWDLIEAAVMGGK
jgi:hypothetical protein